MPDSSNVSPEAEDLARVLNAAVRPRWMHSTQEFWLTPAQAAIDAGWTPPPDPHEDIAREIRDEAFPADAGTPFPGDRVEMRILAAVRRMDLRRGDQIGPTGKTEMDDESCGLGLEIDQWDEPMRGHISLSADARLTVWLRNHADVIADLIDAARVSLVEAEHDDQQIHGEWGVGPYREAEHIAVLRDALAALDGTP